MAVGVLGQRIVRGNVFTDGTIGAGEGFSVAHAGPGDYVLTFDVPFASYPIVVVSLTDFAGGGVDIIGFPLTPSTAWILSRDSVGVADDADFDFIAVGP